MKEISKARYVLIGLTVSSYAVVSLLATITGFKVDYPSFVASMSILALIAAAGGRITTRLQLTKTRALIDNYSCGLLLVIPIVIATYMSARLGMPWADDRLQSMDAALGFNWLNLVYFIDERRYLAILLNISYVTFQYQLVLLPILLTLSGSILKSYQTIIIYAVVCYVSCVVSIWYPALGTYSVHGLDPQNLKHVNGVWGTIFLDELNGVRNDPNFTLTLNRMEGIITFPSVHAAVSVLCVWSAWDLRWFRYPFLFLNTLMATSAVVVSNHYLVDIIAGFGIAGLCISAVLIIFKEKDSKFGGQMEVSVPGLAELEAPLS